MKTIPLTQGYVALIDDEDHERVAGLKWSLHRGKGRALYGKARLRGPGKSRFVLLHRFILDALDGEQVDHRFGDGLDNRWENLRRCDNAQNHRGFQPKRLGSSSPYRGVHWHTRAGKWQARIHFEDRTRSLGLYRVEEDAARAYDTAARQLFGDFAQPNFP